MVAPYGRFLDGPVHPLDPGAGPSVVGLGEPVLDIAAGAGQFEGMCFKGMGPEEVPARWRA